MEYESVEQIKENYASLDRQTPTEKRLANMWCEIFGISDVKLDSDFFNLGGNSLTAIKWLTCVEDAFGEEVLSPDTLFSAGQLGQLAAAIDATIKEK